jgi:hypothetical protein
MLPDAAISHSAYGRTRFRVPSKRGEHAFFAKVAERLQRVEGIEGVEVNSATGSILVNHRLPLEGLLEQGRRRSLFRVDDGPSPHLGDQLRHRFGLLNGGISRLTEGRLDLEDLALIVLIAVGVRQLLAGQFAAPALTAFFYAATLLTAEKGRS